MPHHPGAIGPVDDDIWDPPRMAVVRNDDVEWLARAGGQAEQGRCGLVAEDGTWSGPEHDGPQPGIRARLPAERGVDPTLKLLPAPGPQQAVDHVEPEAGVQGLLPVDHPALALRDVPAGAGYVNTHAFSVLTSPGRRHFRFPACGKPQDHFCGTVASEYDWLRSPGVDLAMSGADGGGAESGL